jgi:hypothetical protein
MAELGIAVPTRSGKRRAIRSPMKICGSHGKSFGGNVSERDKPLSFQKFSRYIDAPDVVGAIENSPARRDEILSPSGPIGEALFLAPSPRSHTTVFIHIDLGLHAMSSVRSLIACKRPLTRLMTPRSSFEIIELSFLRPILVRPGGRGAARQGGPFERNDQIAGIAGSGSRVMRSGFLLIGALYSGFCATNNAQTDSRLAFAAGCAAPKVNAQ